jgi:SOS-response transcriptional repressor LexA
MVLNCSGRERGEARKHFALQFRVAYSWNSELPSGHNPFWIRDEALSGLRLHTGDAVSVDTRAEARTGDLVVVELEVDGDSVRMARRYIESGERIRLESVGDDAEVVEAPADQVIIMGVIAGRLRFNGDEAVEEPLL